MKGKIKVGRRRNGARPYSFGTFRDHSWDIRNWAAMDSLFILLLHFDKPLCIGGVEYHYFDLTLVDMPGNTNGVQSFTTGYFSSKDKSVPNLPITHATSIRQLPFQISTTRVNANSNPTREPSTSEAYNVSVHVECEELAFNFNCDQVDLSRRVMYFPEGGNFHVFEATCTSFIVNGVENGYGTRQIGYRACDNIDLSEGGVG